MIENRQGVIFSALLPEEIASFIPAQPAFRSKQICKWIADGAHSFEHMHNIPAALRASLAQQGAVFSSKVHTANRACRRLYGGNRAFSRPRGAQNRLCFVSSRLRDGLPVLQNGKFGICAQFNCG